jgi:hypothetical protein
LKWSRFYRDLLKDPAIFFLPFKAIVMSLIATGGRLQHMLRAYTRPGKKMLVIPRLNSQDRE